MFTKKENLIEFDFNGLVIKVKAYDVHKAYANMMKKLREGDPNTDLDAEQMEAEVTIIRDMLKEIFTATTLNKIIKQVWEDEKPDYWAYRDLMNYVAGEMVAFSRDKLPK